MSFLRKVIMACGLMIAGFVGFQALQAGATPVQCTGTAGQQGWFNTHNPVTNEAGVVNCTREGNHIVVDLWRPLPGVGQWTYAQGALDIWYPGSLVPNFYGGDQNFQSFAIDFYSDFGQMYSYADTPGSSYVWNPNHTIVSQLIPNAYNTVNFVPFYQLGPYPYIAVGPDNGCCGFVQNRPWGTNNNGLAHSGFKLFAQMYPASGGGGNLSSTSAKLYPDN